MVASAKAWLRRRFINASLRTPQIIDKIYRSEERRFDVPMKREGGGGYFRLAKVSRPPPFRLVYLRAALLSCFRNENGVSPS